MWQQLFVRLATSKLCAFCNHYITCRNVPTCTTADMSQVVPDDEDVIKSDVSKSDMSRSDEEKIADVDNLQPGDDLMSPPLDMSDVEPVLTLENPNPPVPKEVLQDIDLTPFIR